MADCFIGIENEKSAETIVKKSRFLSFSYVVTLEDDVKHKLQELKKNHPKASHICFAYKLFSGETKCSDDGEPSGTAGLPILEAITKRNIFNVLIVVVRYFGGIKLGAGGLLRAYLSSAKECLKMSGEKKYILCTQISVEVDINEVSKLEFLLKQECSLRSSITYGQNAKVTLFVSTNQVEKLTGLISGALGRNVIVSVKEKGYI